MLVELRTPTGTVGKVRLISGRAVADRGAKHVLRNMTIIEPGSLRPVTQDQGERYLRALPIALSGTYLWATLVEATS